MSAESLLQRILEAIHKQTDTASRADVQGAARLKSEPALADVRAAKAEQGAAADAEVGARQRVLNQEAAVNRSTTARANLIPLAITHRTATAKANRARQAMIASPSRASRAKYKTKAAAATRAQKALTTAQRESAALNTRTGRLATARAQLSRASTANRNAPARTRAASLAAAGKIGRTGSRISRKQLEYEATGSVEAKEEAERLELKARARGGDPHARAGLKRIRHERIKSQLGIAGSELGRMVSSEGPGDVVGAGVRATGGIAGAFTDKNSIAGKSVNVVTEFTAKLAESVEKLRKWSDQLHESNMRFSEFSGGMAGVAARQEVRDIMLSKERGDQRAGSAEKLAQSRNRLERAVTPMEDLWASGKNIIASIKDDAVASILEGLVPGVKGLNELLDEWINGNKENAPAQDILGEMADRSEQTSKEGRPGRFPR